MGRWSQPGRSIDAGDRAEPLALRHGKPMVDPFSLAISVLSLAISSTIAWLTLRGTVKMTQPTIIFFCPDLPRTGDDRPPLPKVYLRTLRGRVVESMHVALSRNETHQNFNIWLYGEREKLVRGSGLFVGETGVAANHHFLTPEDGSSFPFYPRPLPALSQ